MLTYRIFKKLYVTDFLQGCLHKAKFMLKFPCSIIGCFVIFFIWKSR